MKELKEKIAEILHKRYYSPSGIFIFGDAATEIISLPIFQSFLKFQEQLEKWEMVEKCTKCFRGKYPPVEFADGISDCPTCQGTGTIRRPLRIDLEKLLSAAIKLVSYKWPEEEPGDFLDELRKAFSLPYGGRIVRKK